MHTTTLTTSILIALSLALTPLALACGDVGPLEEVDPEAAPAAPTWSEHVGPIVIDRCSPCHGYNAQPGPLEGYSYESCEQTKRNWGGIVETVFQEKSMPPAGAERLTSSQQLTLKRWREQGSSCQ